MPKNFEILRQYPSEDMSSIVQESQKDLEFPSLIAETERTWQQNAMACFENLQESPPSSIVGIPIRAQ
jgi:hypothetical protein